MNLPKTILARMPEHIRTSNAEAQLAWANEYRAKRDALRRNYRAKYKLKPRGES